MLQVAGAITFKNYVKRNWKVGEEGPDKIHASDRNQAGHIFFLLNQHPAPLFTFIWIYFQVIWWNCHRSVKLEDIGIDIDMKMLIDLGEYLRNP